MLLLSSAALLLTASGPVRVSLVEQGRSAPILVDPKEESVVGIAAGMLADDIAAISGVRPASASGGQALPYAVIAGTLGKSSMIDQLAAKGKLRSLELLKGRWEGTLIQVVDQPLPGVDRALVIVGSDRRGTAYGLTKLSERLGVSPWTWWADVSVPKRDSLSVSFSQPEFDAPAVKYRGIFINDEDWGLHEWASKTFEPEMKSIGPKTYQKVFELMLRLRLNYLWPAMHNCTKEFHLVPENLELAHRYAIVAGASHCEPMLYNNAKWDTAKRGPWNYATNRQTIYSIWEHEAKSRGDKEAVWTMGIRGIHDQGMQGPPEVDKRLGIVDEVFKDQVGLLSKYVTDAYGPVAKCFVPYKEVLPLYDAGLEVPEDVTLVWVDDNFGYIRRLGAGKERSRPGGAGVYWHLSYYGFPHSYTWINTRAPALIWEELHKAWENDARNLWVINVGDIKPMEIGIDYFSKLAWNPEGMGPDSQPKFLKQFATQQFGAKMAGPIADFLTEFYRLGTIRKPELMNREWAMGLSEQDARALLSDYRDLLAQEAALAAKTPADSRDAYFQLVGFPARILGASGQLFLADRESQFDRDRVENTSEMAKWRLFMERQVEFYNDQLADGKWKHMMPGLVTATNLTAWNSQVRWPWGERPSPRAMRPDTTERTWRTAASADRRTSANNVRWVTVEGLGPSGRAVALKPAGLRSAWPEGDRSAPTLTYMFNAQGGDREAWIDFLPTFRLTPGMQLRVALSLDGKPLSLTEVPGSSGKEDENGANRRNGVQNNFVRARIPLMGLTPGRHSFQIRAVDPGVVIDRLSLPN